MADGAGGAVSLPSAATLWAGEAAELQPAGEARRAHSELTPSSHLPRLPAPLLGFSTTPAAHSLQSPGSAAVPVWGWCPVLAGMWDQRCGAVFPCVSLGPVPMQMFPSLQGPGPLSLCAGSSVSLGPAVSPGAQWPPEVIFQALTLQLVLRSYLALEP